MTKQWCSCNPLREAQEKAARWDAIVHCRGCVYSPDGGETCQLFAAYEPIDGGADFMEQPAEVEPDGFCYWGIKREDDAPQPADRAGVASEAPTKGASNG